MPVVRAVSIGARARERLLEASFDARVIAAVSGAVYLRDQGGEIFWVAPPESVPHRRSILAPLSQFVCRVGAACTGSAGLLRVGDDLAIAWDGAATWSGEECKSACVGREEVALALRAGIGLLSRLRRPRGLARIVLGHPREDDRRALPVPRALEGRWLDALGNLAELVVKSERTRDSDALFAAARGLIGFGEGLTPSGDDFVGGFLFAQRHLERSDPAAAWIDWNAWESFLAEASHLTNAISLGLLADLAEGHGPGPLHSLVYEALGRGSQAMIVEHAARLVQIGESSGWDILAGLAAGMGASTFGDPPLEPARTDREARACSAGK
jgi:hypothetical protein